MKVVGVVQARMTSSRLPGKVLMDVAGVPLIAHTLRRLAAAQLVDEVVLATTEGHHDDPLVALAREEDVRWHRGSEADVLSRVHRAAAEADADVVVRITGDCPLLDPWVVDEVVRALTEDPSTCDYASNVMRRTYPKGLDAEALWMDVLRRIDRLATTRAAREHVTWLAYSERPELFLLRSVELEQDFSDRNWSVDTEEDLARVRALARPLGRGEAPDPWMTLLDREPT